MRTRRAALASLTAVASAIALLGGASAAAGRPGAATGGPVDHGPGKGGHQLAWAPCPGIDNPRLTCAEVRVPLDYRPPAANVRQRSISIVISRYRSEQPDQGPGRRPRPREVLVTTGGGPGGPGVPLAVSLAERLPAAVLAKYDIVGVDQRFVQRSTPITCGQPAEEPGSYWVRSPAIPFDANAEAARQYAADCAEHAGWALPHATTANAARDLDAVRAALGQPKLNFLGSSYAGYVGVAYTRLFPHRVGRFVLDSVIDPAQAWRDFEVSRGESFQRAFEGFCQWAAEREGDYGLGSTGAEVCALWWSTLQALAAEPVGPWTAELLGNYTFSVLYNELAFPPLASALSALARGEAPDAGSGPPSVGAAPGTPADNTTAVSTAVRCADAPWPTDPAVYQRDIAEYQAKYQFVGGFMANITPCAFWPFQQDERVAPAGRTASPVLLVGVTGDAATPYQGTVSVHRALPGSALVTLDAYVHAPLQSFPNQCVDGAVARYLLTGSLPQPGLRCERDA